MPDGTLTHDAKNLLHALTNSKLSQVDANIISRTVDVLNRATNFIPVLPLEDDSPVRLLLVQLIERSISYSSDNMTMMDYCSTSDQVISCVMQFIRAMKYFNITRNTLLELFKDGTTQPAFIDVNSFLLYLVQVLETFSQNTRMTNEDTISNLQYFLVHRVNENYAESRFKSMIIMPRIVRCILEILRVESKIRSGKNTRSTTNLGLTELIITVGTFGPCINSELKKYFDLFSSDEQYETVPWEIVDATVFFYLTINPRHVLSVSTDIFLVALPLLVDYIENGVRIFQADSPFTLDSYCHAITGKKKDMEKYILTLILACTQTLKEDCNYKHNALQLAFELVPEVQVMCEGKEDEFVHFCHLIIDSMTQQFTNEAVVADTKLAIDIIERFTQLDRVKQAHALEIISLATAVIKKDEEQRYIPSILGLIFEVLSVPALKENKICSSFLAQIRVQDYSSEIITGFAKTMAPSLDLLHVISLVTPVFSGRGEVIALTSFRLILSTLTAYEPTEMFIHFVMLFCKWNFQRFSDLMHTIGCHIPFMHKLCTIPHETQQVRELTMKLIKYFPTLILNIVDNQVLMTPEEVMTFYRRYMEGVNEPGHNIRARDFVTLSIIRYEHTIRLNNEVRILAKQAYLKALIKTEN